ncbi:hypothetical protein [Paenibacillus caseinilyticus]|nr:hypothetical protein [Paenibacillus caseinilyticus]MCZ8519635.1 hypothetical protein [Paenibacillus caseinilyticus]
MIISVNGSWILFEEMKWLQVSQQPIDYTSFLIHRSISIPLLVVIAINLLRRTKSLWTSLLIVFVSVTLLVAFGMMGRFFHITKIVHWNAIFDALYFVMLHLIAYYAFKFFHRIHQSEAKVE